MIAIALTLSLVGCAAKQRPPLELPSVWRVVEEQAAVAEVPSLLDLIESPQLEDLAREALARNPDLAQTALRVREAEAVVRQARAAWLPSVSAEAGAARGTGLGTSASFLDSGAADHYEIGAQLAWELDVWGRLADIQSSAEADRDALAADLAAARNSLVVRVLQRALEIKSLERVVDVERRRVQVLALNQQVIRERYLTGRGSLADLELARAPTLSSGATLAEREEALARTRRALSVLLGDLMLTDVELPETLPAVKSTVPPIPAATLARRPDVQAALRRVQAADLTSRAELKELLPRFSISATASLEDDDLGDLLSSDVLWSLLGNLTAPLFQGGRLRAEADQAEFAAERSYFAYQQVLLTAVLEVEDALGLERALARQTELLDDALGNARASQRSFEQRYRQGLVDVLDLLQVQQGTFDLERRLEETVLARRVNRLQMGLAAGLGVEPFEYTPTNASKNGVES